MSNFFNDQSDTSLQEGILGCILATGYTNESDDKDFENMVAAYSGRSVFVGIDPTELLKEEIKKRHFSDSDSYLKESCSKLNDEWRPATFAICCDIFKDHIITSTERSFLRKMKEFMNLPDDQANKIIEVISLLYKGKV